MAHDLTRRPASECIYKRRAMWIPVGVTLDDSLTEARNPLPLRGRNRRTGGGEPVPGGTTGPEAGPRVARRGPCCGAGGHGVWRARLARALAPAALALALGGCGGGARDLTIPIVYVVAGRVVDPTTSPIAGLAGASVQLETDPAVRPVTSDADGNFILQGVPAGTHRLRANLAGRRVTLTYDFRVGGNVPNAIVPLFTDAEIDSVLAARGAPAWNRGLGLLGIFALKSTGVPLGDALVGVSGSPGGTLVQTGEGKDPIVLVNAQPGDYDLSLGRGGYLWDNPYPVHLRPGVVLFAAPRARPNFLGFVFADHLTGAPVGGAVVTTIAGPTLGATSTTNFLGQFSLVGLGPGRYVASLAAAGFLPAVTWPQKLDQDTTLAQVVVTPDTLAAWSAAAGGPATVAGLGHLLVDGYAAESGLPLVGETIHLDPAFGAAQSGGAAAATSLAQTTNAPALYLNLAPGLYRVYAKFAGRNDSPATDSVVVRAGEVTATRLDY
jgi:hypothetical protein